MLRTLLIALRVSLVTLVVTGLLYPALVTGIARVVFPDASAGSLVRDDRGNVVGSELVGQSFTSPSYFHGRPSAAGEKGYDALASGGSNLGPTSAKLKERVDAQAKALREANPDAPGAPPDDLLTTSGSGLDPHITPAAAAYQVPRVARVRSISPERVQMLVEAYTKEPLLGFLGEPRVNVLLLNLALDRQFGRP